MSMTKVQETKLKHLQDIFSALSSVTKNEDDLRTTMASRIEEFEEHMGGKYRCKIVKSGEEFSLLVVDCSRDFVRTSVDAQGSVVVRVRSESVLMSVNVCKAKAYAHENLAIASALRAAADKIELLSKELKDSSESSNLDGDVDGDDQLSSSLAEHPYLDEKVLEKASTSEGESVEKKGASETDDSEGIILMQLVDTPESEV